MPHLHDEPIALFRYLLGSPPDAVLIEAYLRALTRPRFADLGSGGFDRFTVSLALVAPSTAALADSYCALFHRGGLLRQKLILAIALVEARHPESEFVDGEGPGSLASFLAHGAAASVVFLLKLIPAMAFLAPVHMACGVIDRVRGPRR